MSSPSRYRLISTREETSPIQAIQDQVDLEAHMNSQQYRPGSISVFLLESRFYSFA